MMSFFIGLLTVVLVLDCLFLILLVLIQKGRGGGLASAFGGGGGNTAFGSKTGDVLTWATSIVFGIFLLLAIALNLIANEVHRTKTGGPPAAGPSAPVSNTSSLPQPLPAEPGIPPGPAPVQPE